MFWNRYVANLQSINELSHMTTDVTEGVREEIFGERHHGYNRGLLTSWTINITLTTRSSS